MPQPQYPYYHEELVATSMLLGEGPPIICSCCMGKGTSSGLFGGWYRCGQCNGSGYDYIPPKAKKAMKL